MGWIRTLADRARSDAEQQRAITRALREAEPAAAMGKHGPATAGGDPLRLRGIPAIGRSVSGAIRGSDPEREVMREDRKGW